MKINQRLFRSDLKYYFLIAIAGILAFLPVSTMQFSLKNDIVALDFPIKYFISQCLQHNIEPFWFNTWAKGFPLESIITWSFFSPLQFLSGLLFEYNLYTLHAEFMFYILLAGFGMFSFLKEHVATSKDLCFLMAVAYMLSGFTVGSSQWMTYITALAFLPLILHSFLGLLRNPSFANSVLLVAIYYVMLTSVYPAFTIIATYSLALYLLFFILYKQKTDKGYFTRTKIWLYLFFTFFLMVLTYSTSLFYSMKVLNEIDRGKPILAGSPFFNSNFLHPKALTSLLLPFSSTRIQIANTEGTMMDSYMGLFTILLLPFSLIKNVKEKNGFSLLLLIISFAFLVASFGHLTPLREALNILPGFSYFRNPGLFRLFYILTFLIYITYSFQTDNFRSLLENTKWLRVSFITSLLLGSAFLWLIVVHSSSLIHTIRNSASWKEAFYSLTFNHTLAISASIQLVLLVSLLVAFIKKKYKLAQVVIVGDLIVNCIICTPFFTVSSYSVKETNEKVFKGISGFPVQETNTADVPTTYQVGKAIWHNTNVYKKQVSERDSYVGPLKLKSSLPGDAQDSFGRYNSQLIISEHNQSELQLLVQHPNYISAIIRSDQPTDIILQQNYYPPWRAFLDGAEIEINPIQAAMKVTVPHGGKLEFRYKRTSLFIVLIILNSLIVSILLYLLGSRFKKKYAVPDNITLQQTWPDSSGMQKRL